MGSAAYFMQSDSDERLFAVNKLHPLAMYNALHRITGPACWYVVAVVVLSILVALTLCVCSQKPTHQCKLYLVLIWSVLAVLASGITVVGEMPIVSYDAYAKVILLVQYTEFGELSQTLRVLGRAAGAQTVFCCACMLMLFCIAAPLASSRNKTVLVSVVLYAITAISQPSNDLTYWGQHVCASMPLFRRLNAGAKHAVPLQSSVFRRCVQQADSTKDIQCMTVLGPCAGNGTSPRYFFDQIAEITTLSPSWMFVSGPNGLMCIPGDEDSQKAAAKHEQRRTSATLAAYAETYVHGKKLNVEDYFIDASTEAMRSPTLYVILLVIKRVLTIQMGDRDNLRAYAASEAIVELFMAVFTATRILHAAHGGQSSFTCVLMVTALVLELNNIPMQVSENMDYTALRYKRVHACTLTALVVLSVSQVSDAKNCKALLALRMVTCSCALESIRQFIQYACVFTPKTIVARSGRQELIDADDPFVERHFTYASVDRLFLTDTMLAILICVGRGTSVWSSSNADSLSGFQNPLQYAIATAFVATFMLIVQIRIVGQKHKILVMTVTEEPENIVPEWASVHVYYVIEQSVTVGCTWFMDVFDADSREKLKKVRFVVLFLTPFVVMQALDTTLQGFTSNQVVSSKSEWWHKLIVTPDIVNWTERTSMFEITCYYWIFRVLSSPMMITLKIFEQGHFITRGVMTTSVR